MLALAAIVAASGTACWLIYGRNAFLDSFTNDFFTFLSIAPKMGCALLVAGFVQILVPRALVARWLGHQAGIKGVTIATGIGAITPGGPMTSFPLVNALHGAGTGRAALVAYLTAWATLGFQRILIWELPLLGFDFALLRQLASIPAPFIAAFISERLPAFPEDGPKS
jgi:uncharacterized membrane protein YraQ (UPF0718 family)